MTLHYNKPIEPRALQILKTLNRRMPLTSESLKTLYKLQKGHEGEIRFWKLLKKYLSTDCIVLYDLLHESNDSLFQLDCIIIQQREIWHLEIKNYEGDYQLKGNNFFSLASGKEVNNPLHQLDRGKLLLNRLLEKHSYNLPLKSYVIFIHPEFAIYQEQPNLPIVHPTQIMRFIKTLNKKISKLNSSHYKLAHKLFFTQATEKQDKRLPVYEFEQLKKGLLCLCCNNETLISHGNKLDCKVCNFQESHNSAIIRNVLEFNLLFPDRKITTNTIWEWCGELYTPYKIRKKLYQFLLSKGKNRYKHFILPNGNMDRK